MNINELELKEEEARLSVVLKEIKKQLEEKQDMKQKFRKDNIQQQRELWEQVGPLEAASMDGIAQYMNYITGMKQLKREHEFSRQQIIKYEKMYKSPYFGRIDFTEEGEAEEEKIYIGISGLIDENDDFLIYDWRAPVSSMYYDSEVGKAEYSCPQCIIKGSINSKRQYKISDGKIQYMFDSNLKIDDEILQQILSKSADSSMKTIVTTIQREQNKVIRNEDNKILIVQGPAGSGKTSIALHRIAYLLYKHRDKITSNNILIFSPNDIFNDYISNVLPELGEENICQTTYKDYMHKAIDMEIIKEDMADMMEYILNRKRNAAFYLRIESIKFKVSYKFGEILRSYADYLDDKKREFKDVIFRNKLIVSKEELQQFFNVDYKKYPFRKRLSKIRERILFLLEPYEKERVKDISEELSATGDFFDKVEILEKSICTVKEEIKPLNNMIDEMTEFNLTRVYKDLFKDEQFFEYMKLSNSEKEQIIKIGKYTRQSFDEGILNYEDQPPLLYLKIILGDIPDTSFIKYIIIDEAQDYTPLQYEILKLMFPKANITMLGDLSQSINPYMNVVSYDNILKIFDGSSIQLVNLTKSYRSTAEITTFSRKLMGNNVHGQWVDRRGEEPEIIKSEEDDLYHRIIEDIGILKNKGHNSIAVITRTASESFKAYKYMESSIKASLIQKSDEEYVNGVVIIPSYLSKGLEFDAVIIMDAGGENYTNNDEKNLLYTICTRALHVLHIYYKKPNGVIDSMIKSKNS